MPKFNPRKDVTFSEFYKSKHLHITVFKGWNLNTLRIVQRYLLKEQKNPRKKKKPSHCQSLSLSTDGHRIEAVFKFYLVF